MKAILVIALILSGCCGYRLTSPMGDEWCGHTFCVPFAKGDHDGHFTEIFIQALTEGGYRYQMVESSAIIWVTLENIYEENIGFQFDRNREGRRRDSLVPNETRLWMIAYVRVVSQATGCDLIKPFHVRAFTEFDHEFYSTPDQVNVTSLGQVTDIDDARDAAMRPLYRRLSQKIVDYLTPISCNGG